jgi:hypothetical protein
MSPPLPFHVLFVRRANIQVPLPMFNWSGNKGSFKGQIPFYGKTGIEFYTERKVCPPLDMEV